jgi:hypothetical protein
LDIVEVPCGACMFARRLLVKFNLRGEQGRANYFVTTETRRFG